MIWLLISVTCLTYRIPYSFWISRCLEVCPYLFIECIGVSVIGLLIIVLARLIGSPTTFRYAGVQGWDIYLLFEYNEVSMLWLLLLLKYSAKASPTPCRQDYVLEVCPTYLLRILDLVWPDSSLPLSNSSLGFPNYLMMRRCLEVCSTCYSIMFVWSKEFLWYFRYGVV